jgi:hypothetical protein
LLYGNLIPFAILQREKRSMCWIRKVTDVGLVTRCRINRPVEAREHVRRFHELFTLAPDKSAIESNMKRAFDLADKSAFDYYRDLSEKDIITGSSQEMCSSE